MAIASTTVNGYKTCYINNMFNDKIMFRIWLRTNHPMGGGNYRGVTLPGGVMDQVTITKRQAPLCAHNAARPLGNYPEPHRRTGSPPDPHPSQPGNSTTPRTFKHSHMLFKTFHPTIHKKKHAKPVQISPNVSDTREDLRLPPPTT